jgi:SAM-dependent methyltransferase
MRTTEGKGGADVKTAGDAESVAVLLAALDQVEVPERWAHGFHTYPAGIHPDAARLLVGHFASGPVLDPFCGGGTVLVEARAAGFPTFGLDLSPTAVRVARARTATPDEPTLNRARSIARALTAEARAARDVSPPDTVARVLATWYAPHVMVELEVIRRGVVAVAEEPVRMLLEAAFSSILVKTSFRKSDTSAQREVHDRPAGTAAVLFHKKVRELGRRLTSYREAVPAGTPDARIRIGDAREIPRNVPLSLVLTSPPYPATYDYLPLQHLRRVWLDDDNRGLEREIGARRHWRDGAAAARRQWALDTIDWTASAARAMAPGGRLVVVIGDGLAPAGVVETLGPTRDAAHAAGLGLLASASVYRPDHARGTGRWEHALAFEKPR